MSVVVARRRFAAATSEHAARCKELEAAAEAADAERAFAELELNNACAERDAALERAERLRAEAEAAAEAAGAGASAGEDDAAKLTAARAEVRAACLTIRCAVQRKRAGWFLHVGSKIWQACTSAGCTD